MAAASIQDVVSDDFDYERWAQMVRTRLVENGVWDVVENVVSPNPTKIPELAATIKVVDLAQWRNRAIKDMKALKIMQSSLPDSVFKKTVSVASAKDLWDLLKKGNDTEEAKLRRLEKQFEQLRMYEGEKMDLYVKRVLEIVERFSVLGNPKSDDEVIRKLITSLSSSYDDVPPLLEEFMTLPDLTLRDLLRVFELFGDDPKTMPHELKRFIEILRKAHTEQMWCGVCKEDDHNLEDCYYKSRAVTMASASIQDVDFGDFDYERWAQIVKPRLMENGVWDVVENGVSPNPTKIPELAATIKVVDLEQWRNRVIEDIKALKIMQASLSDSVFRKTISVASAKDLWDLLKKSTDKEEAKLRRVEKQFNELMMDEYESMDSYLGRVMRIVDQYPISGIPKSDAEVIRKLLTSLSSSYDDVLPVLEEFMNLPDMLLRDLISAYEIFGDHPETMPHELKRFVTSLRKAKSEQLWCGVCKKYNHNQEDCYYNPRVLNSSGAKQFRGQCFHCGESGHCARDCCNSKNLQPAGTQAQIVQKRERKADFKYDEDMWMIYKTTSNHMTPHEKFFTTLDRTFRAKVELANGNVIMAEGKGDVKILMKGVRMTITNVFFVPGLNRNVLSFGQMEKRGYSMEMGGGECTIRDGTGKIFAQTMREKRGIALRFQVIERYSL